MNGKHLSETLANSDFCRGMETVEEKEGDVAVEELNFKYIENCDDKKKLREIIATLKHRERGQFPALERAAEKKMVELMTGKERAFYCSQKTGPTEIDRQEAQKDLLEFEKEMKANADSRIMIEDSAEFPETKQAIHKEIFLKESERVERLLPLRETSAVIPIRNQHKSSENDLSSEGGKSLPEVRSPDHIVHREGDTKNRLKSNDYDGWDKFDVEKELNELSYLEEKGVEVRKESERMKLNTLHRDRDNISYLIQQRATALLLPTENLLKALEGANDPDMNHSKPSTALRTLKKICTELELSIASEKIKGNECFKSGDYAESQFHYSNALIYYVKSKKVFQQLLQKRTQSEPLAPLICDSYRKMEKQLVSVVYSNRCEGNLKLKRFDKAESDATACIECLQIENKESIATADVIRSIASKAYFRRGRSRFFRANYRGSVADLERSLFYVENNHAVLRLLMHARKKFLEYGGSNDSLIQGKVGVQKKESVGVKVQIEEVSSATLGVASSLQEENNLKAEKELPSWRKVVENPVILSQQPQHANPNKGLEDVEESSTLEQDFLHQFGLPQEQQHLIQEAMRLESSGVSSKALEIYATLYSSTDTEEENSCHSQHDKLSKFLLEKINDIMEGRSMLKGEDISRRSITENHGSTSSTSAEKKTERTRTLSLHDMFRTVAQLCLPKSFVELEMIWRSYAQEYDPPTCALISTLLLMKINEVSGLLVKIFGSEFEEPYLERISFGILRFLQVLEAKSLGNEPELSPEVRFITLEETAALKLLLQLSHVSRFKTTILCMSKELRGRLSTILVKIAKSIKEEKREVSALIKSVSDAYSLCFQA